MLAMIRKEFREVRRDRRTLAMLLLLPLVLLIVFGYAASFDVEQIKAIVYGPDAEVVEPHLPDKLDVVEVDPTGTKQDGEQALQDQEAVVAIVTGAEPVVLIDGSELFSAKAAQAGVAQMSAETGMTVDVEVLFNPDLSTSAVMVPAIIGFILVFIGTVITSLGIVRERQVGTLEQLAVMPFRASDVILGKIVPYLVIAVIDLVLVTAVGVVLFDVPFEGSFALLALGGLLFLLVTLGLGILISTVSQNQGQAIQLALMTTMPQVLLSGMVFPIDSMAASVRWIAYLLPLTWFIRISRGVMLRGASLASLWLPYLALAGMALVVFSMAVFRFRQDLGARSGRARAADGDGAILEPEPQPEAATEVLS
ncbi:MAG: putative multidrug ABC transporter permease YbhS [Acidimicrobiales bacterium]|nr:MAG: ABC transporter permease [Actinomycetota bacterium]MBV6507650.1 putative multidrug ABC transporter permease YbhS [Acidimicrobiales bacterium]RIK07581.1 MAG: ABC transporter permease [Acidobacteriota bacterium]